MKIRFKDKFIETKSVIAVTQTSTTYSNVEKFMVNITFINGMQQFEFNNQIDASTFMEQIFQSVDDEETAPLSYLDGFKAGTEYALKLIKESK